MFRVGTRLVQVDVVVRNQHGPVTGLTKDDFTIVDCKPAQRDSRDPLGVRSTCKGKQQPIQVFREASGQRVPPPAIANATAPPPGTFSNRTNSRGEPVTSATVVLLDQLNTSFDHKGYARDQVVKFLKTLRENDRVAVYSLGKNLHLLLDFTDDPEKLIKSVTHVDAGLDLLPIYEGDDSLARSSGGGGRGEAEIAAVEGVVFANIYDNITLQAIQRIVQHLAGVPGRKNLVWVKETPQVALTYPATRKIMTMLREANIAVYPVMTRSLKSSGVFSMTASARPAPLPMPELGIQRAARDLGASLGGAGFADAGDIGVAVRTAEEDSNGAYTLGFYPIENDLDGTLHQLSVAVSRKAAKGTVELHYRTEYLATPKPLANQISLSDLFDSPLNATTIGLTAVASPEYVDVAINVGDIQLAKQSDHWTGLLRIASRLELIGAKGVAPSEPIVGTIPISLTDEQLQAKRATGLVLHESIHPVGQTGSLRVVVQDTANGATGSLRIPLTRR